MEQQYETVERYMNTPKCEFRPYPFWCWNGKITQDEITWQMEQCHEQRIWTVLIHPRHGLEIDYFSEEYFELIRHTASEARRLNMKIILYDEYNWPSGTVAGRLLRDYPQYRMRFLRYEYAEWSGSGVPDILWDIEDQEVLCIQAVELNSGTMIELQSEGSLPTGRWGVAVFRLVQPVLELDSVRGHSAVAAEQGYLDTMNGSAVRKFIASTHEVYYRHLEEYIPDVVEGIFTDEPGMIYDFDFGYDFQRSSSQSLPWTGELEDAFRCRKGYSLRDRLIHLIVDVPGAIRTRLDYWDIVTSLYTESYHAQIADWCTRHELSYTGHNMCEEMSLHYQGDLYASMKSFTIPGIDWTSKMCDLEYPAWLSAKVASSITHVERKPYAMCETFGASGWGLRMGDMKRVADLLAVLGIHRLCLHSFFYTIRGVRAYECPPSEFFQNPMWEYMGTYSEYAARLGSLLSMGVPSMKVGLLVPVQSYWSRNCRNGIGSENAFIGDGDHSISRISRAIVETGVEYEIIFDTALDESMIQQNELCWGESRLDTVILPPVRFLKTDVWRMLCTFMNGGGHVILIGSAPVVVDEHGQEIVLGSCGVREIVGDGCMLPEKCLKNHLLKNLSRKRRVVDANGTSPVITSSRHLENGGWCFFAYNTGDTDCEATFEFKGRYLVEHIDIERGSVETCDFEQHEDRTQIHFTFPPHQSRMWLLTPKTNIEPVSLPPSEFRSCLNLGPQWDLRLSKPNVLRAKDMIYIPFPSRKGAEVFFNIICDDLPDRVFLVLEQGCARNITVNGRVTQYARACRYSDSHQIAVPVEEYLRQGTNQVRLEYDPTPQDEELSPLIAYSGITNVLPHILIAGDFAVSEERHLLQCPTTISNGPWASQGFPEYAGACVYGTSIDIQDTLLTGHVLLVCDIGGGYMDVTVNGQSCGHRIWEPYELDVSEALRAGRNRIEIRVSGPPERLFAPLPGEGNYQNPLAFLRRMWDEEAGNGLLSASLLYHE